MHVHRSTRGSRSHTTICSRFTAGCALALLVAMTAGATACRRDGEHGHEHGAAGHGEEDPEPLAITRWTEQYEFFVELPPPLPGKPVAYHAHVTALDGFKAVTQGAFQVRYRTAAGVAAEAGITGVKRPGIFVFEGQAPAAGTYALEMSYQHEGKSEVFDCGQVTVADAKVAAPEAPSAAITFLKESQWTIPFATAWAEDHPVAREIELPAVVEPAASDQLTLGAPTGGRFFHDPKLSLAEGRRIRKGDVIGRIAPTVSGDDFTQLELAVEEKRVTRGQVEREIARVEPMVQQGLLAGNRLIDLRNERETLMTHLRAAESRLARVTSSTGEGGVVLRAPLDGAVAQVLVPNGEPVEAGTPLVRVRGSDHLWLRSRFVARPEASLVGAIPVGVRLPGGERVDLAARGAHFLSPLPLVDPASRIATWIVDVMPDVPPSGSPEAPRPPELRPDVTVVLLARVGAPRTVLAVPHPAVVEIDTRSFVFVQVDGEHFEKRAVTLGDADGAFVELKSGLTKGERVVTRGGFDIHLASLMGTLESHRH